MDSEVKIDAGEAIYTAWDGTADINLAATGFKLVATSGLLIAMVCVKTEYAS